MSRLLLVALVLASRGAASDPRRSSVRAEEVVRTQTGLVAGYVDGSLRVFKRVPYAAPPVGELRWRAPRPVTPWRGVLSCRKAGPVCAWRGTVELRSKESEDCVYLNIWTPATASREKLPVMVWIDDGQSVRETALDGSALAREGLVVVTFAYRRGVFGFLAHPLLSKESPAGASGNYALLDQIALLRWVRENIDAFGGDPDCVTVAGEMAGATCVWCLMASRLTKGLFHRAIAQSGSVPGVFGVRRPFGVWARRQDIEGQGQLLARRLRCNDAADPVRAMRLKSTWAVLRAAQGFAFGPCIDGEVVADDPLTLFEAGKQHSVPLLSGSHIVTFGRPPMPRSLRLRPVAYRSFLRSTFGKQGPALYELFPAPRPEDVERAYERLITVASFVAPARAFVRAMAETQSQVYLYQLSATTRRKPVGTVDPRTTGIPERIFVFGSVENYGTWRRSDDDVWQVMRACWVQFARRGDPNRKGLPYWPAYSAESRKYMEFDDGVHLEAALHGEACDIIERARAERMLKRRRRARSATKR